MTEIPFRKNWFAAAEKGRSDAAPAGTKPADAHDSAAPSGESAELRRTDNFLSTIAFGREMAVQSAVENRVRARGTGVVPWAIDLLTRRGKRGLAKRVEAIRRSGVFDVGYYLASDPLFEETGRDPILHYVLYGWREGRDPSPYFSVAWYLETHPDIAKAGIEPLSHYLESGAAEGRDPHPLFHGKWYLQRYRDVAASGMNPLAHFVREGVAQHRDPHPLFDSDWYLASNPDVAASELSPFLHYIMRGASEQRDPHPLFSNDWYRAQLAEPIGSGEDALRHYLRHGAKERTDPHPLFDTRWYLKRNPDVAHLDMAPLMHFLQYGVIERREHPHPLFSPRWYLSTYQDLGATDVNPLTHFVRFGGAQHRSPHPMFDTEWYLETNRISLRPDENPLLHYLNAGAAKGLSPHPMFASDWYVANAPEAERPIAHPLVHYLTVGIFRLAPPNPGMTAKQCVRLLSHIRKETFFTASLTDLLEKVQPWDVTPALEALLKALGSTAAVPSIRALYDFLGEYEHGPINDADLANMPELLAEVDALSRLAQAKVSSGRIDATIVIPVYNQIAYTLCCLKALLGSPTRSSFEIIVADDLSNDATATLVGRIGGVVRHHRGATNLGFTRNCNAAASLARGETIVLLNNDTIPLPGWLDELVDTLRADPSIGLAGSKLLNSDGSLQEAGGILWRDGSAWNFGRGGNALAPEFNYVKDVDYVSGAAIAVRKSVWAELGGLDEAFVPAYCEDSDLAFRIRRLGLRTVYQPFSAVVHHEGVSHGRDLSTGIKAYQVQNNKVFFERWKDVLARENLPNAADVMLARDRSRGRRHLLVIDHYIPEPDRDAGSRTISQYLQLLQASGLQVTFWSQNRNFHAGYAKPLQRQGIEVHYDLDGYVTTIDQWLAANGRHVDYVLLSRAGVAYEFISAVRAGTRAKILFYGHDVHFRRLEMEAAVTGNAATREEAKSFETLEREVWSHCDAIYYPSEEERAFVAGLIPDKIVRAVPPFIYGGERLRQMRTRLEQDKLPQTRQLMFVGGYRHRPNIDAMLWFAGEIWPRVLEAEPRATLCIAGSFPPPEIEALSGPSIMVTGAISDDALRQIYQSTQVVIVPLRFGAGVKGKVMEAASYGRPIVSTSVGVQGLAGAENFVAIADTAETFAEAVIGALREPDQGTGKALAGLDFVSATASEEATRRVFAADIPELNKAPEHERKSGTAG